MSLHLKVDKLALKDRRVYYCLRYVDKSLTNSTINYIVSHFIGDVKLFNGSVCLILIFYE